ncbi:MAG TPA: glycosyltransferase family 39 protein [Pseudomonadales bacterium]|nr:glycosyltransferase family 39 protein [Pseudomonadales bacterium]
MSNNKHNPSTSLASHGEWLSRASFLLATAVIYLWQLGHRGLWQSEDRWAEIARNMVLTGDYFHPIMNATVYFDKPLVSYWFIALVAKLAGVMNEWVVRFPSAAMGMLGLYATYSLAKKHWSHNAAWLAVWLLLTSFGVIFWSRTAAADMANAAM